MPITFNRGVQNAQYNGIPIQERMKVTEGTMWAGHVMLIES